MSNSAPVEVSHKSLVDDLTLLTNAEVTKLVPNVANLFGIVIQVILAAKTIAVENASNGFTNPPINEVLYSLLIIP